MHGSQGVNVALIHSKQLSVQAVKSGVKHRSVPCN